MRLFGSDRIASHDGEAQRATRTCPSSTACSPSRSKTPRSAWRAATSTSARRVLQYDDVMNQQREIIYGQRRQVLMGEDMKKVIADMRETLLTEAVERHCAAEGE